MSLSVSSSIDALCTLFQTQVKLHLTTQEVAFCGVSPLGHLAQYCLHYWAVAFYCLPSPIRGLKLGPSTHKADVLSYSPHSLLRSSQKTEKTLYYMGS